MTVYHTESKLQGWRALAIFEDGSECLIFLGRSTTQVRAGYAAAFQEILDEEERAQVKRVSLQCWNGAPDEGKWIPKGTLAVPGRAPAVKLVVEEEGEQTEEQEEKAKILTFRQPLAAAQ